MLDELNTKNRVVGLKQTQRAITECKVKKIFIADDADPRVINPILAECEKLNIEIEHIESMADLGNASGIEVSAAVAAILK